MGKQAMAKRHGTVRHGMAWHGMLRYGMVRVWHGLACPYSAIASAERQAQNCLGTLDLENKTYDKRWTGNKHAV